MLSGLSSRLKKLIYQNLEVRTFVVTRLLEKEIIERVVLIAGKEQIDITRRHSMICLDPFCVAVWLPPELLSSLDPVRARIRFVKGKNTRSVLSLTLVEKIEENQTTLLLYRVTKAASYQLNPLFCFLTLFFFLRNKTTTYWQRKCIAALYAYPRKIISITYQDKNYCNIFPMDIQGHIPESGLYILGLRTTNQVLEKVLLTKKIVIADTHQADIKTIYALGRHLSISPPPVETLPFSTSNSELFSFPVPSFSSSYMEVEIIENRKMGYHMLLVGRIINTKRTLPNPSSLYHVHLLEFLHSGYENTGSNIRY
jgi:hypothetical protein